MTVTTKFKCYLCSKEGLPMEMSYQVSPAIGHRVDFALNTTWLCPTPCYQTARNSYLITGRIQQEQDTQYQEYKVKLQEALVQTIAERPDPAHLPDGLRVTEDDLERLAALDGDYSADNMQDEETVKAAFKLLRNYKRLPYYHCRDGVGVLWDYDELRTRLDNLARKK